MNSDWTFDDIERFDKEISQIAEGYKLDTYPNQIEIVRSDQMIDAYASIGMPIGYNHWSFGKHFVSLEEQYRHGHMGLAYELVINSNPCIAYLMEENTATMQALVIAHACYGHNSFFKGNYLFKTWTSADTIIDYLVFAKKYIAECEEKYGVEKVEQFLDSCHALMNYGVDRYKRPSPITAAEEKARQERRQRQIEKNLNDIWRTLPNKKKKKEKDSTKFPSEPQENLLYFLEKNAPFLEIWQREIVRIVRKLAQYFFPQRQTQVMNEGWATFWHYTIMHDLYDKGILDDGAMLEFLSSHTSVVYQPPYSHPGYYGLNPYALGFEMFKDIKRICENPNDEDREWFPDIAGGNWREVFEVAMNNFKDESFILQFLSPRLIRHFHLFSVMDQEDEEFLYVSSIHDKEGYREVRQKLASMYNLGDVQPNIQITKANIRTDRSLELVHTQFKGRPLDTHSAEEVLKHLYNLWQFPIKLESQGKKLRTFKYPEDKTPDYDMSYMGWHGFG